MSFTVADLEAYFDRLWPICRSITGKGFRDSLDILAEVMPMERFAFETGDQVFDWTIPKEWNVRDAYLIDPQGVKRAWFKTNNLHLMGYSAPFRGNMPLADLKGHLYSLPDQPRAIPYVTSYYKERWGFCLTETELRALPDGDYEVVVDTLLEPGRLHVAEAVLEGNSREEIFFSSYLCHPSLANNELSGPLALAFLYKTLAAKPDRHYTYRFAIVPETIGSIAYLTLRGGHLKRKMIAGYQLTCVGDAGDFTYKSSRRGDSLSDRAARLFLMGRSHRLEKFDPSDGSDERQYSSPAFNLPIGSLMRTMYGKYPQYHTSLDNKDIISFEALSGTIKAYEAIVGIIDNNETYLNRSPHGEPQLGKRGLYPSVGQVSLDEYVRAMMWVLNLSDGEHDLIAIAEKSGLRIDMLLKVIGELKKHGLLETAGNRRLSTES
jgi:aminopeptidase-like protein